MATCNFFNTAKGCSRGTSCRFSHEAADPTRQPVAPRTNAGQTNPERSELQQWIFMIPRPQTQGRPLAKQLPTFFAKALHLARKDDASSQEVILKLASDGGLQRISELVEIVEDPDNARGPAQRLVFNKLLLPLFELMSLPSIKRSYILEAPLATLLTYCFGIGGRRAAVIFDFTLKAIDNMLNGDDVGTTSTALHAALSVFADIAATNGTATISTQLQDLANRFQACVDQWKGRAGMPSFCHLTLQKIDNLMNTVRRRFEHGDSIPELKASTSVTTNKAKFVIERDLPGTLSKLGPRHDNDFADIKKIRILPTASEVQSVRPEYLPTTDTSEHHLPGLQGLLDRHFRLLREDTVGQLRDAVSLEFNNARGIQMQGKQSQHVRTSVYENAALRDFRYHKSRGLDLLYEFAQPKAAASAKTAKARKDWWQSSRRLQDGALVCILDTQGTPIYCSVATIGIPDPENTWKAVHDLPPNCNVFAHADRATVMLSVVDLDDRTLELALAGFINGHGRAAETLIEFPGILLASFRPTLKALQAMSGVNSVPFADILAPQEAIEEEYRTVTPPAYTAGNFRYGLSSIVGKDSVLTLSTSEKFDTSQLLSQSSLDPAQADALVSALSRRLALIQGPPGTGKSYTGTALIKVLLENQVKAQLGPIICVCYTNHALDQLLVHLVESKVDKVVRIGGRSKEAALEDVNLRSITQKISLTKVEKHQNWQARQQVDEHIKMLNDLAKQYVNAQSTEYLRTFLESNYPHRAAELFAHEHVDDDGWQNVRHKLRNPVHDWLSIRRSPNDAAVRPIRQLQHVPLMSMSQGERVALWQSWIIEMREIVGDRLAQTQDSFVDIRDQLEDTRREIDLRALSEAKVIGVTTTGLARITELLGRLNSKVLICEEAGEVLEAHTLITLLPSIEHMILIGDHLQLRPRIQNYSLQSENRAGAQYSFDMSLFERLVSPPHDESASKVPYSTLETQRRMHPSIAELVRSTLYPRLQDADSVDDYPSVSGMRRRLFWLDHRHLEARAEQDQIMATSHSNDYEVSMTVGLVNHLVKQGTYHPNDIAILTPVSCIYQSQDLH
jgi:hypothetical protein